MLDSSVALRENIKVLAVSLDNNGQEYYAEMNKLNHMQHFCDYLKWDSKPVKDYHIVATPTFFMLDKDRFIIGKYSSIGSLLEQIRK